MEILPENLFPLQCPEAKELAKYHFAIAKGYKAAFSDMLRVTQKIIAHSTSAEEVDTLTQLITTVYEQEKFGDRKSVV